MKPMGHWQTQNFYNDEFFMFKLYMGLVPRSYDPFDDYGCIIQEEDKVVDEILFVMQGTIGTGFSRFGRYDEKSGPFKISKK